MTKRDLMIISLRMMRTRSTRLKMFITNCLLLEMKLRITTIPEVMRIAPG